MKILPIVAITGLLWYHGVAAAEKQDAANDAFEQRCGFVHIKAHETEAARNTQLLHPDWGQELLKQTQATYQVGDTLTFYSYNYQTNSYDKTPALCRYKSSKTYFFVGLKEWNNEQVTDANVTSFYQAFELSTPATSLNPGNGIRKILEDTFGPAPNKSGDGYVYILIYDIQEGGNSSSYIAGYFMPNDQRDGLYSNRKDVLYVDCNPGNPSGSGVLSVVAHEFQHLLHYGNDRDEDAFGGSWVNEGCSEYASVLCGYRLRSSSKFLRNPDRSLLLFDYNDDSLIDYEKVALWTYYLGEKFGPALVGQIAREPGNSTAGVRDALSHKGISLSLEDVYSNFMIANYVNDLSLDANNYYGYKNVTLTAAPPSVEYKGYPVNTRIKELASYSSQYIVFSGQDSTAQLSFASPSLTTSRAVMISLGSKKKIETLARDAQGQATISLSAIGKTADHLVLLPISFEGSNFIYYSATTSIEDFKPPVLVSGPRESLPGSHSVTIFWETDELANGLVQFGSTSSYGSMLQDTTMSTSHRVSLTGLKANTLYHYRVGSTDGKNNGPSYSADFTFTTDQESQSAIMTLQQAHAYGYGGRSLVHDKLGALHFLYHEYSGDNRFIYHRSSTDQGKTWSSPVQLDATLISAGMPSVAIDSLNRLHVCFHAKTTVGGMYGIFYSRSDDGGITWRTPVQISILNPGLNRLYSAIAVDPNNNPHVVWNSALYDDRYRGDVFHAFSKDGGNAWETDQKAGDTSLHNAFVATIDFDKKGRAHIAFADGLFDQATENAYYAWSDDYTTWSAPQKLSNSGYLYDSFVTLVVDSSGAVHAAYADNYTPGDIRVMYTHLSAGIWSEPQPVASSLLGLGGHVYRPNISCDDAGSLLIVYGESSASATVAKARPKPMDDIDPRQWRIQQAVAGGDVFITLKQKDNWLPGVNLSADGEDSDYPEMPRRQKNQRALVLFMKIISETSNQANLVSYSYTLPKGSAQPSRILRRSPAANAVDVPYFSNQPIWADFDQRLISDSLVAENVIFSGSKSGSIVATILFEEYQKRLKLLPHLDLQPDEDITIRLRATITNEYGIGLDGNENGLLEGSPADDIVWSFHTQNLDRTPPVLSIGLAQNPVLSRYLDVYVFSKEELAAPPSVLIGSETVKTVRINESILLYKADYRLGNSGTIQLTAKGTDLAGNEGQGNRSLAVLLLRSDSGGRLTSEDGSVQVAVPAGSVTTDEYMSLWKNTGQDVTNGSALQKQGEELESYTLCFSETNVQKPFRISIRAPRAESAAMAIQHLNSSGQWIDLATVRSSEYYQAESTLSGVYRLATANQQPEYFALEQNYPNPFSAATEITSLRFQLPERQYIEIAVYNVLGEKIATLRTGETAAGRHMLNWNGRDHANRPVAAGLYFYRLSTASTVLTKKLIILR
jgi:hypothetical protein